MVDDILVLALDIWAAGIVLYFLVELRLPACFNNFQFARLHEMQTILITWSAKDEGLPTLSNRGRDLLLLLLSKTPRLRPTAAQSLGHPWFLNQLDRADEQQLSTSTDEDATTVGYDDCAPGVVHNSACLSPSRSPLESSPYCQPDFSMLPPVASFSGPPTASFSLPPSPHLYQDEGESRLILLAQEGFQHYTTASENTSDDASRRGTRHTGPLDSFECPIPKLFRIFQSLASIESLFRLRAVFMG